MRKVLLALALLSFHSCAIVKDGYNKDPEKLKEYIMEAPGLSQDQLFVAVNTFVTRVIRNRPNTIEYEDKEAGKVIGYLFDEIRIGGRTEIRYKYEIDVKDGKLRFRFSYPQFYSSTGRGGWSDLNALSLYNELVESWELIPDAVVALAKEEKDW